MPELAQHLEGIERLEKLVFSAAQADGFDLARARPGAGVRHRGPRVRQPDRPRPARPGDVEVQVAADAVTSRTAADRELGLAKMERAGALPTSTETALFELVGRAGTDEFKAIQKLVL